MNFQKHIFTKYFYIFQKIIRWFHFQMFFRKKLQEQTTFYAFTHTVLLLIWCIFIFYFISISGVVMLRCAVSRNITFMSFYFNKHLCYISVIFISMCMCSCVYLLKNSQINQHPVNRKDITDTKGCEGT